MTKVALVTGASRGIGAGIAARLIADGYFVVGTATSEQGAAAIQNTLSDQGLGLALNVAEPSSIDEAFSTIKAHGSVSVLVNNAGITRDNLMLRMSDEEWQSVVDTNLNGVYRLTKACLRGMVKARWGRIINVG